MKIAKDGLRSIVRVGYDGRVYKTFRGTDSDKRFANEVQVLKVLEERGCDFVPRLLEYDEDELTIVTTNCGTPVEKISEGKQEQIFAELRDEYGVEHDDPFARNITYEQRMGRFCVIDFELATILDDPGEGSEVTFEIEWCGLSKGGKRKMGRNEDALSVFGSNDGWAEEQSLEGTFDISEEGIVFAVSDGMGGPGGGELASSLTVSELRRFLPGKMGDFKGVANWTELLESAVVDLHRHVARTARSREELVEDMGATLVTSLFFRKTMHFAHVGDSRIYHYRNGDLAQLTMDQTMVGQMFRKGLLNEREARNHPRRNILSQAIGGGCPEVTPQIGQVHLEVGDWVLLCTDGLIDGLWERRIHDMFESASDSDGPTDKLAKEMLDYSYCEAGGDDTTLFVVKVGQAGKA
ncbi:MAG: SpoIIE family protein phosphatase [Verrucomicrobiales bacterium]|nr:SpoIIE family protein phosphatase [Verrucomicrobiales bacterium]